MGWLRSGSRFGSMLCGMRRIRRSGSIGIGLCCRMVRYSHVQFISDPYSHIPYPTSIFKVQTNRLTTHPGHCCLFQYANLYLSGYKAMTWEQLLSYHSDRADSLCPGHPEIEHEGIELTTGPLGQGIANAVGLAIASRHLGATFNRPGYEVVNNHTWCSVGDACLQGELFTSYLVYMCDGARILMETTEGVGCEALSYAGHLKLTNLTVIYDNNQITCDGSVDLTNTEDVNKKMEACGWDVIDVHDGVNDVAGILAALESGRDPARTKPLFINVRSIIGVGSAVAGKAVSHGVPLGKENVAAMKKAYGWDPEKVFHIPDAVKKFYADLPARGERHVRAWEDLLERYSAAHPELAKDFKSRMAGQLPSNWQSLIPTSFPSDPTPTRKSNNLVAAPLFASCPSFLVGTADLSPSVNLSWPSYTTFNPPDLVPTSGARGSYAGRYLHYGIREHLMAALSNGLAAFSPGTILPITSTFFMFYLYAAPAVRMGALQALKVIHVATHDSIGAGEDGPTHQPVELGALFRAMPGLTYLRPGDSEEVAGAWSVAVDEGTKGPCMISVSRHAVPQLTGLTRRDGVKRGAYVLREHPDAHVTLIGVGAELSFAVDVADRLAERHGVTARVVSFPCHRLFREQGVAYQRDVLRRHEGIPAVVVEPYVALGWERWADAGVCMKGFGHSLPGKYVYGHFGYEVGGMARRVEGFLGAWREGKVGRGEFVEL